MNLGETKLSVYSRECAEEERGQLFETLLCMTVFLGNKETEKEHKWK